MSTVPIPTPERTLAGRWNLAKSLMQREPSEDVIRGICVALSGGTADQVAHAIDVGIDCWACFDVVAPQSMCPVCGLYNPEGVA